MKSQNYIAIDKLTYELYLEKNWNELIQEGKDALRQGVDYYYLRMRIGIAYYEKRTYKSAGTHFKKALEFNAEDPLASEYLYFAYTFSGQTQQAALLYEGFSEAMKTKIPPPDQKAVDRISLEYLYSNANTDELVDEPATFDGLPNGVQFLPRYYHNMSISMHHMMHPGSSLGYAYTYLEKSNYYFYDDGSDKYGVDGQKVWQHQFFLSPSFTSIGGLVISPAIHLLRVGYQIPYVSTAGGGGGAGGGSSIQYSEDFLNQMVFGLSFTRYQGSFNIIAGAHYSNLNHDNQMKGNAGLTWYPLGNLDMYLGASLNVHFEDLQTAKAALIPDLVFGYGIASKVWLEVSGSYGDMKNYNESNGYIVYNGMDWLKYKAIGTISVPLTSKGSVIYAGTRFAGYENWFIPFDSSQAEDLNKLNYTSLSIFGGLSWKF